MESKTYHKSENNLRTKQFKNSLLKNISTIFSWGLILSFLVIVGFIIYKSVDGIKYYGIENILFTDKFEINDASSKQASVWIPLGITLLISFCAVLIATPISIKTASLIKFRLKNEKLKKWLRIIIETCSGIPSVIFGLFASQSLGIVVQKIFGLTSATTILTAIFMLSFMIMPTITSLTLNAYDNIDSNLISTSISLGITRTKSIYKIFKRQATGTIIISVLIALGRAIGETMAVSMLLNNQSYVASQSGLIGILDSNFAPLGAIISINMFSENGGENLKSLLYFYGIILFFLVLLLNGLVMFMSSKKNLNKYPKMKEVWRKITNFFQIVPRTIYKLYDAMIFNRRSKNDIAQSNYGQNIFKFEYFNLANFDVSQHISNRNKNSKWLYVYSYWKIFWELLSSIIVFGFISWIVFDIIINGFIAVGSENSTFFKFNKDSTGQAFVNTVLIVIVTIAITFPIALLIAIYLNEYVKNKKTKKTALFFIDSLGATPSIIFGMFGLAFFIQILGVSIQGRSGQSLLAGALTVGIVLLPNFIRNIQQALENVPNMIRENGYALGCLKHEVVFKLVLSMAFKSIVSAIILSVGRIISETAPLYLTAGLSSPNNIALLSPGQTLTTRIYANTMFGINADQSLTIQYESALSSIILVLFLTILGYMIIPYYKYLKQEIKLRLMILKQMKDLNLKSQMKLLKKQIYEDRIYITEEQKEYFGLDSSKNKFLIHNNKKYQIKYLTQNELEEMIKSLSKRGVKNVK